LLVVLVFVSIDSGATMGAVLVVDAHQLFAMTAGRLKMIDRAWFALLGVGVHRRQHHDYDGGYADKE